jgi:predicted RNA-binding Zn-ribbon protein involved in translation (DUF1610 family)
MSILVLITISRWITHNDQQQQQRKKNMFLFIIAGVGPRNKTVKYLDTPCPNCAAQDVAVKRVDRVFKLFFIPIFRYKKGQQYEICQNCGWQPGDVLMITHRGTMNQCCSSCGTHILSNDYSYCPKCGKHIAHHQQQQQFSSASFS